MFFFLSKTFDLFLSPLFWGIALAAVGFLRQKPAARGFSLAGALVLYIFSIAPVANRLMASAETPHFDSFSEETTYDAVVLLGGAVDHGSTATAGAVQYNDNVERLLVTYDLLRRDQARLAILSGGRGGEDDPVVEAEALASQLEDWGIDRDRLIVEANAKNTRENAVESARIVRERGLDRVVIVTSAFHMHRSLEAFRAVDLEVDALSTDYKSTDRPASQMSWLPRAAQLKRSSRAIREMAGRWVYRIMGYGSSVTASEQE